MQLPDLNLLRVLDALLRDESVTRAAERLQISVPAASRALARLRRALKDPVLVRAGRRLVATPAAQALRARARAAVEEASALLRPGGAVSIETLERAFIVRTNGAVAGCLPAQLAAELARMAPGVTLRFAPEGEEDVAALRNGDVDLDIGVIDDLGPEIRVQRLFVDHWLGAVRREHPLARGRVTAARYAAATHVATSRRGRPHGPIDAGLAGLGLVRRVMMVVPDMLAALAAAATSDLVASVPGWAARHYRLALSLRVFELPVPTPESEVSLAWHPRLDADPAHQWLRERIRAWGRASGARRSSGGA